MKTAEEILLQNLKFNIAEISEHLMPKVLLAMKEYANHKLDEAKERIWDASLTADRYWNEKLILSLKDEV